MTSHRHHFEAQIRVVTHTARSARRDLIRLSHTPFAIHISLYLILMSIDFIAVACKAQKGGDCS
jgi:hypothetical protein